MEIHDCLNTVRIYLMYFSYPSFTVASTGPNVWIFTIKIEKTSWKTSNFSESFLGGVESFFSTSNRNLGFVDMFKDNVQMKLC